jgi:Zn-dependent peptidase ImmA (M78 family)/transcriptional regulator with XRE-family HTH domain
MFMSRTELADRLKRAREAAGLALSDAATRLGFQNYQTLSSIEKGEREVKANELILFAKTYFCNLNSLLLGGDETQSAVHFLWRKAPANEKKLEIEALIRQRIEQYQLLENLLGLEKKGAGNFLQVSPENIRTNYEIDTLANRVGNIFNIGGRPAFALQKVMEQMLGIKILFVELSEFGSAASTVHPEFGASIVVNCEEAPWRINFTLAHELFHILTWNICAPSEMEKNGILFGDIEKKADRFASTLLLPENEVRGELSSRLTDHKLTLSDLIDVAREFGVSTQALVYRMVTLRLIQWEQAEALVKSDDLLMLDRRSRKSEGDKIPVSERFILLAVKCLRKALISRGKFAELLNIDRVDIDEVIESYGLTEAEGESVEIVAA